MATSELENTIYLLSQGLESGGEGRFTLNKLPRSPALLKAAEQVPYRWVYFAVQAAVCVGAVSVRLGSNATSVSVEFEVADVPEHFLLADLLAEGDAREPVVSLWARAVLWASALNPLSVEVLCEGSHAGYRLSIVGESSQKSLLAPSLRRTRLAVVVHFGANSRRRMEISACLEKHFASDMAYVNLPVKLEGSEPALGLPLLQGYKRVALQVARPEDPDTLGFVIPSLLSFGEYRLPDKRGALFRNAPSGSPQLDLSGAVGSRLAERKELRTSWDNLCLRKDDKAEWLLPLDFVPKIPGTSRFRCGSLAFFKADRPARFFPVHHGLALLPIEMPEAPTGWDLFWPTPRQSTDYPGLAVVQDESFLELRKRAVAWLWTRAN